MRKRSQDASITAVAAWYREDGARFLCKLGIRSGERVLDFGCGTGGYTIPLAQAVGPDGKVIAADKNAAHLAALRARLVEEPNWDVVDVRLTAGALTFDWIAGHFLDAALLFDVLQFVSNWGRLFSELRRLLKPKGLLLVNPSRLSHPGEVDVERLKEQLPAHGFVLERTKRARVMHYDSICEEEILVFRAANGLLSFREDDEKRG